MSKWRYRWLVLTRGVEIANALRALFEHRHCQPVFEVRDGSKIYRIYGSGMTDGFGPGAIVVNRLHLVESRG